MPYLRVVTDSFTELQSLHEGRACGHQQASAYNSCTDHANALGESAGAVLTWRPVDDIRGGNGANLFPHCSNQILLEVRRRRILCALHMHSLHTVTAHSQAQPHFWDVPLPHATRPCIS